MSRRDREPTIFVLPAKVVADALYYLYDGKFSNSDTYRLDFDGRPKGRHAEGLATAQEALNLHQYADNYAILGVGCLT